MNDLALKFEAHRFWEPDNLRASLRLLVSPVYRYDDVQGGVLDGAVFVLAHGTNPEILMFVEAHAKRGESAMWYCGFAPLGSAELHVTRDSKDVWMQPRAPGVVGQPSDPYWLFVAPDESAPPRK